MKIERDGTVVIPEADISTFLDYRLPLVERLTLLANWLKDTHYEAAKLVYEAADRQKAVEVTTEARTRIAEHMTQRVAALSIELERTRREHAITVQRLEEENGQLRGDVERLTDMLERT